MSTPRNADAYKARRTRLAESLEAHGLTIALITSPSSVYYFTGFLTNPHERFLGLFVNGEDATLVLPAMEAPKASTFISDCRAYTDQEGPLAHLGDLMRGAGASRLGVEKEALSLERAELLREIVPKIEFAAASPLVNALRVAKDAEEAAKLREAARMVDAVLREGLKALRPGMTEMELLAVLETHAKRIGSRKMAFDTIVLSGAKSAEPHGHASNDPILNNEFLLIDMGVEFEGYFSDITRTYALGDVSDRHRDVYEAVLKGQKAAIEATKPGAPIGVLDQTARGIIREAGFGDKFTHRLGHGLGLDVHEYPSLTGDVDAPLEPGMCFTIEPGVYIEGFGGVRIEDDILVTNDGHEVLTHSPKEWDDITISF